MIAGRWGEIHWGNIIPDPKRFPNGMKALADNIHGKGLKLVFIHVPVLTLVRGRPGSREDNQFQDARQYGIVGC